MNYSPYIFTPDPNHEVIENNTFPNPTRPKTMQNSLSKFNSTLSMDNLIRLNLSGTPRDTSKFYEDKTNKLYLRHSICSGYDEWEDVTKRYDWEKVLSNLDAPLWRYDKKTPRSEDEYLIWIEENKRIDKIVEKYTTKHLHNSNV